MVQTMADLVDEQASIEEELYGDNSLIVLTQRNDRDKFAQIAENLLDAVDALSARLDAMLVAETAGGTKKIDIPYLDAGLLLMHRFGNFKNKNLSIFIQRAYLGNGCMTRKEWSDKKMFDNKTWNNLKVDTVKKYDRKFGDANVVAEAISYHIDQKKKPSDFHKFYRNPKSFR